MQILQIVCFKKIEISKFSKILEIFIDFRVSEILKIFSVSAHQITCHSKNEKL